MILGAVEATLSVDILPALTTRFPTLKVQKE
jgi:hypothetical protein